MRIHAPTLRAAPPALHPRPALHPLRSTAMTTSPDGRAGITAALVTSLLAEQAPQWAHLPVAPVPVDGWDNRT